MMIYPRFLARILAFLGGYFWLPCSLCGKNFAGFEWGFADGPCHDEDGKGTCSRKDCLRRGAEIRYKSRLESHSKLLAQFMAREVEE